MTVATQAGIDRKTAFADALKIREKWTKDQLEDEEAQLAEEARAMVEAGQAIVLPTCRTFPGGAAWRAPVRAV